MSLNWKIIPLRLAIYTFKSHWQIFIATHFLANSFHHKITSHGRAFRITISIFRTMLSSRVNTLLSLSCSCTEKSKRIQIFPLIQLCITCFPRQSMFFVQYAHLTSYKALQTYDWIVPKLKTRLKVQKPCIRTHIQEFTHCVKFDCN